MKKILFILSLGIFQSLFSQVQVFTENFGSGTSIVDLPSVSTTASTPLTFTNNEYCDGNYRILSSYSNSNLPAWHTITADHTGNTNGRYFMAEPCTDSVLYTQTVSNLSQNKNYTFSVFFANMCNLQLLNYGNRYNPLMKVVIKSNSGAILAQNTIQLGLYASLTWENLSINFNSGANQSIVIEITNLNNYLNCSYAGNDFIMDDLSISVVSGSGEEGNEEASITAYESELSSLNQSTPNPTENNAKINYYLSTSSADAEITLYSIDGKVISRNRLNKTRGEGSIQLNLSELSNGIYFYSLYIDGNLIDTKRLEIAK